MVLNGINMFISVASLIALSTILALAWSTLMTKTGFTKLVQNAIDGGCLALCEGTAAVVHTAIVEVFNGVHDVLDPFAHLVDGGGHPDPPPNEIKNLAEAYYAANVKPSSVS